jgi:hypothetical protein
LGRGGRRIGGLVTDVSASLGFSGVGLGVLELVLLPVSFIRVSDS